MDYLSKRTINLQNNSMYIGDQLSQESSVRETENSYLGSSIQKDNSYITNQVL